MKKAVKNKIGLLVWNEHKIMIWKVKVNYQMQNDTEWQLSLG